MIGWNSRTCHVYVCILCVFLHSQVRYMQAQIMLWCYLCACGKDFNFFVCSLSNRQSFSCLSSSFLQQPGLSLGQALCAMCFCFHFGLFGAQTFLFSVFVWFSHPSLSTPDPDLIEWVFKACKRSSLCQLASCTTPKLWKALLSVTLLRSFCLAWTYWDLFTVLWFRFSDHSAHLLVVFLLKKLLHFCEIWTVLSASGSFSTEILTETPKNVPNIFLRFPTKSLLTRHYWFPPLS